MDWKHINNMGLGSKAKAHSDVNPEEFASFLCPSQPGSSFNSSTLIPVAIQSQNNSVNNPSSQYDHNVDAGVSINSQLAFRSISEFEVLEAIGRIKSNAQGHNGIPIKFLKIILPFILPKLTYLFNKLIMCSHFPDLWKTGLITPIPKISSPISHSDWRPITVLPAISKAFESIIADQIKEFVEDNNLLSPFQSGFRSGHSTCTALAAIVDDVRSLCDNGDIALHVLLDLSKAFESVSHNLLLFKLCTHFGFSSSACTLVASYLANRSIIVTSNNSTSAPRNVFAGVPQGAVLAPILFTLFINDVSSIIQNVRFHIYADDLQIYAAASPDQALVLVNNLNTALTSISDWCSRNGLSLNPAKSQAIIYSANLRDRETLANIPPLTIQNQAIPFSGDRIKNLGLLMDPSLSWMHHINTITSRIYFGLRSLYAVSHHIPQHVRLKLISALILPYIFYADIVVYPLPINAIAKINKALKACVRYIYGLDRRAHISALMDQFLACPLSMKLDLRVLSFIFRAKHKSLPEYIHSRFAWSRLNDARITLPRTRTQFARKSLFVQGASLWNSLPNHIRQQGTLNQFNDLAMQHLINLSNQ